MLSHSAPLNQEHVWYILNGFIHLRVRFIYSIQKIGKAYLILKSLKIICEDWERHSSLTSFTGRKQQPGETWSLHKALSVASCPVSSFLSQPCISLYLKYLTLPGPQLPSQIVNHWSPSWIFLYYFFLLLWKMFKHKGRGYNINSSHVLLTQLLQLLTYGQSSFIYTYP